MSNPERDLFKKLSAAGLKPKSLLNLYAPLQKMLKQIIGRGLRRTNYDALNQPLTDRPEGYEATGEKSHL